MLSRLSVIAFLFGLLVIPTIGCGEKSKKEDQQPKMLSKPDPRIKGPAAVGGAGAASKSL